MPLVNITIGSNVCAYADVKVDIPVDATTDQAISLIKLARAAAEDSGTLVFDADWSSQDAFRVTAPVPHLPHLELEGEALDAVERHRIKCWMSVGCALVTDDPIPGCDLVPLLPNTASFLGAKYRLADSLSPASARLIASALDLELLEAAPVRNVGRVPLSSQAHSLA